MVAVFGAMAAPVSTEVPVRVTVTPAMPVSPVSSVPLALASLKTLPPVVSAFGTWPKR